MHVQAHARALDKDRRTADDQDKARAVAYPRWLAARDGVEIGPEVAPECEWDRAGNDTPRIRRVWFRRYTFHEGEAHMTACIDLPNWQFEPSVHITTARAA